MIDTDDKTPIFPPGYTTCSECGRLILAKHANMEGQCGGCEESIKPLQLDHPDKKPASVK